MNPSDVLAATADAAAAHDPLDDILRQIVGGYFVLTDGQGSVSKWSEPAELLFGRTAEEILGESFFTTLIGGELSPAGQAWRGFLDTGEPPRVPGTVQLTGRCSRPPGWRPSSPAASPSAPSPTPTPRSG